MIITSEDVTRIIPFPGRTVQRSDSAAGSGPRGAPERVSPDGDDDADRQRNQEHPPKASRPRRTPAGWPDRPGCTLRPPTHPRGRYRHRQSGRDADQTAQPIAPADSVAADGGGKAAGPGQPAPRSPERSPGRPAAGGPHSAPAPAAGLAHAHRKCPVAPTRASAQGVRPTYRKNGPSKAGALARPYRSVFGTISRAGPKISSSSCPPACSSRSTASSRAAFRPLPRSGAPRCGGGGP